MRLVTAERRPIKGLGLQKIQRKDDRDKLEHCLEILERSIEEADETLLLKIMEGNGNDIDKLFEDTLDTTYRLLYGSDSWNKDKFGRDSKSSLLYLKEYDQQVKEQLRIASLTYFAQDVLNMEINWHHIEWGWLVENFNLNCILAARDHGKSFFFSHAYPIWKMYKYDRTSPRIDKLNGKLGYLFSNTSSQACDLIEIIKDSIADIPILRERLYPSIRETWTKQSIKLKNGSKLRGKGMGSSTRGAHPGYIIVDDGLKDNVLYSKVQRERNKTYFNSVILNMLIPKGEMIVVGTPFHKDDLYSIFKNSTDFTYREYPAMTEKGDILWKGRHDLDDLLMRKKVMGSVNFTREFLVKPISSDTAMFPDRILERSLVGMGGTSYIKNIEASKIKFNKVITGGDFAISANVGADFTSFVTFGIDDNGNMYLLNIFHKQGVGFSEQKRVLKNIWKNFKPDVIFLEANQFQRIYQEQLAEETDMPVRPFTTTVRKHSLEDGVPGLCILFENGKIKFPYATEEDINQTETILDEFRNIGWTDKGIEGVGEHDDIVMSIWIARMASMYNGADFLIDFMD